MRFHPELEWAVSWPVLIVTPVVYLATVFALKRLMQHRAGFNLLILLRVFNGVQIGLSLLMCWQLCGNLSLWNPFMLNSEFTKNLEWWLFVHYLAKYWDLFESAFIVLRKREAQLNSLHLFHHCSILVIWGWLLHIGLANGTAAYGAFINSFVHAVMYGHLYSGGDAKCMVVVINKSSVVLCQVSQFVSCMLHAILGMLFEKNIPTWVCAVQLLFNCLLVGLFLREARKAKHLKLLQQQAMRAQAEGTGTIRSQLLRHLLEKQAAKSKTGPASPSSSPAQQQQEPPVVPRQNAGGEGLHLRQAAATTPSSDDVATS